MNAQLSATDYPTPEQRGDVASTGAAYWGQPEESQRDIDGYEF